MWWSDLTFWSYSFTAFVGLWGFILFFWWMGKNNLHASLMFWYVMLLLLGAGVRGGIDAHARYLHLTVPPGVFLVYTESIWWFLRSLFPLLIKVFIVTHMTYRALTHVNGTVPFLEGCREGIKTCQCRAWIAEVYEISFKGKKTK